MSVVRIRSRSKSAVARFRSNAVRCGVMRPSLRNPTLCLILFVMSPRAAGSGGAHECYCCPPLLPGLCCFPASLLPRLSLRSRRGVVVELHPEGEAHAGQDLLDLVERLPPEVLGLEHLSLGLLDELADGLDVRVLEAVVA